MYIWTLYTCFAIGRLPMLRKVQCGRSGCVAVCAYFVQSFICPFPKQCTVKNGCTLFTQFAIARCILFGACLLPGAVFGNSPVLHVERSSLAVRFLISPFSLSPVLLTQSHWQSQSQLPLPLVITFAQPVFNFHPSTAGINFTWKQQQLKQVGQCPKKN